MYIKLFSNDILIYIQVCVADFHSECGENTVTELNSKHCEGKAIFCKCDVTSKTDFEGILTVSLAVLL